MAHPQHLEGKIPKQDEFEAYVLDVIKSEHPEWIEPDGDCARCVAYYHSLDHAIQLVE